ncbi:hypothetical protein H257_03283 [Aphanomyces astaci]|uniref:Peptidase M13 C-terminal domain-containing protein n=1 Tax=Aphanomyces astaci TaxID=112090 RepID=W4H0R7_APHAT|nr:hypothetical protein H257_03283 [Aphanomyces astaci]ETV85575.1 hypothetical protein H257_03283 [Aphanomyces astaci]|eukprot:XP_009825593.1 hypothetical protein H257_03283 [Aphanomyces astaci]
MAEHAARQSSLVVNLPQHDVATDTNLKLNGQPVDTPKFDVPLHKITAEYRYTMNQIVFRAVILQNPLFDGLFDASKNFAIGMVIGHEITHGFDNYGRKLDGDGNLNPCHGGRTPPKLRSQSIRNPSALATTMPTLSSRAK